MRNVRDHYDGLLAPIYTWMVGGIDDAMSRGAADLDAVVPGVEPLASAVDLGAGFGAHAILLARQGCAVVAVDTSRALLGELRRLARGLSVQTVEDDLRAFRRHVTQPVDVVLCMGDTLTHLATPGDVEELFTEVAAALRPGGLFVLTFRDYSNAPADEGRFVLVRSDDMRILTCVLEYASDHVIVHDVLHERAGDQWFLRVSAYRKLRLWPEWVVQALGARGFSVQRDRNASGLVRVVARSAAGV